MKQTIIFSCLMAMAIGAAAQVSSDDQSRYPMRREVSSPGDQAAIRATFTVAPGQSVQAAVDRARPGDRIEILPGVYHEAVTIDFDSIELVGLVENGERAVFDGRGEMEDGVMVSGNNFYIRGIEFRNYKSNGVVVNQAKNVIFEDVVAINTGKYGVYPVMCDGVIVQDCVVSDVWDAGVYAGQCRNVEIFNCEAFRNTIGIETENCVNVLIHNNTAHDNSLGILVVLLPDLPTKEAANAKVVNNRSYNNNYPNLSPPGQIVNLVQPGVGIAINAADNTEVTKNTIIGNDSYGITMYALTDVFPPEKKLDVEPNPDGNRIHGNTLADNGAKAAKRYVDAGAKGGDIFWSGKGTGNVFNESTTKTFPETLPGKSGPSAAGGI